MSSILTDAVKKLPVSERIALVEEIRPSITQESACFELTGAQKQGHEHRIQSFQENPHAGRTWEEIKTEFLSSK